jgi:ATP-dependent exoDNAse (exonuclease V) beta subunit
MSPVGPRADLENDPLHRYIELAQSTKDRHEQGRLLYVACTRARKSLHLLGHVELNKEGTDYRPANSRSLLSLLWPSVSGEFETAFEEHCPPVNAVNSDGFANPVLRRIDSAWSLPKVQPLPGSGVLTDEVADGRKVEFYWVGAAARLAGTVVHRWLQMAADGRAHVSIDNLESLRPVSIRWLQESGVNNDLAPQICDRVEAALRGTLQDEKGLWILGGEGHSELRLSGLIEGRIESVVLDRVRIDSDGIHWIIDYKTSTHEGGDLKNFLMAELDRYRPQLSKYASLYRAYSGAEVRCALYFPLLRQFVELGE